MSRRIDTDDRVAGGTQRRHEIGESRGMRTQPCSNTTLGPAFSQIHTVKRSPPQRIVLRLASAMMGASAGSTLRRGGLRNISSASQPASELLNVWMKTKKPRRRRCTVGVTPGTTRPSTGLRRSLSIGASL